MQVYKYSAYSLKNRFLLICLAFARFLSGQSVNYISNGSFESLNSNSLTSLYNVVNYWQPIDTGQFCDYLVTLRPPVNNAPYALGFQYPKSEENYIITTFYNIRGYPRNRLRTKLKPNTVYCATYHIVNTNNNPYGIDSFGMLFADSTLDLITNCNAPITTFTPQIVYAVPGIFKDTLNWTPVTGTFVATGYEKYCVLGNFKTDAQTNTLVLNQTNSLTITADICIDDVSCIELDLPAFAGRDTVVFVGDSVFLGRTPDVGINEACTWYRLPNTQAIDTIAGFWIKPTQTSTYVVRQEICGYVKFDTVNIYMNALSIQNYSVLFDHLSISPSPASDLLQLKLPGSNLRENFEELRIYSAEGQLIRNYELTEADNFSIFVGALPNGIYSLSIRHKNSKIEHSKKIVVVH